jgi:DNA-binding NtrC family response regulator
VLYDSDRTPYAHEVLLVDDDDAIREMMTATLEQKGFEVVAATNVTEALKLITTKSFDVLITDPHMPNPSDGFAVITAMRHLQPKALTLLVSGYPDVKSAMDATRQLMNILNSFAPAICRPDMSFGNRLSLVLIGH